jgi:hypothetical protein
VEDLRLTIVEGFRYTGEEIDLSTNDTWSFALDQRAFGPRRLMVVSARQDGGVLGLAHLRAARTAGTGRQVLPRLPR